MISQSGTRAVAIPISELDPNEWRDRGTLRERLLGTLWDPILIIHSWFLLASTAEAIARPTPTVPELKVFFARLRPALSPPATCSSLTSVSSSDWSPSRMFDRASRPSPGVNSYPCSEANCGTSVRVRSSNWFAVASYGPSFRSSCRRTETSVYE